MELFMRRIGYVTEVSEEAVWVGLGAEDDVTLNPKDFTSWPPERGLRVEIELTPKDKFGARLRQIIPEDNPLPD